MAVVSDFCDAVGLTEGVRRWLRENPGDPLREEIIDALMAAIKSDLVLSHRSKLRTLIAKIARSQKVERREDVFSSEI